MYEIYHQTSLKNLASILDVGFLVTSSSKIKRTACEGNYKRRLTKNPFISLSDKKFYHKYDEVDAVYMRLKDPQCDDILNNDVMLVFQKETLDNYNFVINTEENNGFMIAENGMIGVSQFSGEDGISIYNKEYLFRLEHFIFHYRNSEVAILEDVDLKFLKKIIIKRKFLKFVPENLYNFRTEIHVLFV